MTYIKKPIWVDTAWIHVAGVVVMKASNHEALLKYSLEVKSTTVQLTTVSDKNTMILEIVGKSLLVWLVNEQRSFVDDLAFPRGCKFSSWLSSTRNWDLSWWMVLIDFRFVPFLVKFYRKDFLIYILVDRCTTKLVRKSKPNDKNLGFPCTEEQSHILP